MILAAELRDPGRLVHDLREHQQLDVVRIQVVALDVVGVNEHPRHQRVVRDVTVAFVERRERLLDPPRPPDRFDDAVDPAAEVVRDLVRLPALRRSTESVTDRGAGQATDSSVGEQVSVHVRILACGRPARRPAGETPTDRRIVTHPETRVQPSDRFLPSSASVILPARYWTKFDCATSAFQRWYGFSDTQLPLRKCTTEDVATLQLPVRFVDLRMSLPEAGLAGISQSPAASFARFWVFSA